MKRDREKLLIFTSLDKNHNQWCIDRRVGSWGFYKKSELASKGAKTPKAKNILKFFVL